MKGNGKFSNSTTDSNSWFNVGTASAPIFTTPTAGTFTAQKNRNILRAPGQDYFNASLQKTLCHLRRSVALNFRIDAFDFPNHPNWNAPDTTYVDAAFGKVTSKNLQRSLQGQACATPSK